ncbi:MAG: hemolysin family protein [Fimbriimonadales bacterium]
MENFAVTDSMALWSLTIIFALLVLNALLNLSESALSGLRAGRLRELIDEKDRRGMRLAKLNSAHATYYATCRVGEHICRAGIYTITALASPWLTRKVAPEGYGFVWVIGIGVICVFFVAVLNLALIESPFSGIARKNAEVWAARLSPFISFFRIILAPIVWVVLALSGALTSRLNVGSIFSAPIVTEEDLREMVEASGASGELIEDEREMIHSIIEFTDTVAREVMTPRTAIDACEITATAQEVAKTIDETGHTRIPIYQGSLDRIVGVVHAKDLLRTLMNGNGTGIKSVMRPAMYVHESKDLHGLLQAFRKERSLMAIVQDEFGGTAGLVTMEDVVEEIVGQIVDEYDDDEPEVQSLDSEGWLVDGRLHLDDVNDEIGSDFESEEFDTLGGYVFGLFGRHPSDGDSVEDNGWLLEVHSTDGRRILRVKAQRREPFG